MDTENRRGNTEEQRKKNEEHIISIYDIVLLLFILPCIYITFMLAALT